MVDTVLSVGVTTENKKYSPAFEELDGERSVLINTLERLLSLDVSHLLFQEIEVKLKWLH